MHLRGVPEVHFRLSVAWLAVLLLVAPFFLAGCSEPESGVAISQAPIQDSENGMPPTVSAPSSSESESQRAGIDPCSIVTAQDLSSVSEFEEGVDKIVGNAPVCEWKEATESAMEDSVILTVAIREDGDIGGMRDQGYGLREGTLDSSGRELVEQPTSVGCVVAMAVGEGERVEVGIGSLSEGASQEEACQMAGEVVELIDPKLPLG